jgi:hypothetical protein
METVNNNTELTTIEPNGGPIFAPAQFEHAQRIAKVLSSSDLVPTQYKNNVANPLVALEMANRMGASPLMVMQNLHIIHGRPSWGSSFIIASLNSCGRFTTLRFQGDANKCKAVATDKATGEVLEGPTVSLEMAKAEGWLDKAGSKWKTMPELMLKYRAAAFFGRLFAPEVLMGMQTSEEVIDITPMQPASVDAINEKIKANPKG